LVLRAIGIFLIVGFSVVFLAGCAGGIILGDRAAGPSKAAFIEVQTDDQFKIRPMQSQASQELKAPGIWVSDGWFVIEYTCFHPKNNPPNALIDLMGYASHADHFFAGHRYALQCDPHIFGEIDLIDTTSGQNLISR
jgi:hypothetical protein